MAKDAGHLVGVLKWAGMALVVAGVLMVVATVLHPSRETATTIVASEVGLVAAHVLYTLSWLLSTCRSLQSTGWLRSHSWSGLPYSGLP